MVIRSSETLKLKLFKWNTDADKDEKFDIKKALNDNWDKIEKAITGIKAENIAFTDGDTFQDKYDSGELKGTKGDTGKTGFSPTITEKTNTNTEYILTITNNEGSFDTPNLKGQAGSSTESGTTDYAQLSNKPKINNVELSGNKTLADLGIISNIPRSKTTTLSKDNWAQNEETQKYECTVADTTITENDYVFIEILDDEQVEAMAGVEWETYSGGIKFKSEEQITANVQLQLVIMRTAPEEASI